MPTGFLWVMHCKTVNPASGRQTFIAVAAVHLLETLRKDHIRGVRDIAMLVACNFLEQIKGQNCLIMTHFTEDALIGRIVTHSIRWSQLTLSLHSIESLKEPVPTCAQFYNKLTAFSNNTHIRIGYIMSLNGGSKVKRSEINVRKSHFIQSQ